MKCPRCKNEITVGDKLCPFCHEILDNLMEFNDYKKDGFLQLKKLSDGENDKLVLKPKENKITYFKLSEMNVFVVSVIFILLVGVITIFGLKALQTWSNDTPAEIIVPVYTTPVTEAPTEATIKNTVTDVSIKDFYGSWKLKSSEEKKGHAIPYYSFDKSGVAQYNYGSLAVVGKFKDFSDKKDNIVYIAVEDKLNGIFRFGVTGNKKDGYTLTLVNVENDMVYTYITAEAKSYKLDTIEDFQINKNLVGRWENDESDKNYVFTADGRFSRRMGTQKLDGVWSCLSDNLLEMKYMEYSVRTINLKYTVFEGNLVINNVVYYKVEEEDK